MLYNKKEFNDISLEKDSNGGCLWMLVAIIAFLIFTAGAVCGYTFS